MAEGLVEDHRSGRGGIERFDLALHRDPHHLVAAFEHEPADPLGLPADDDAGRAAVVDLVVQEIARIVRTDDPEPLVLERVDRLTKVRDVGDEQMLARAGTRLGDGRGEAHRAVTRDDDAVDAGALAGAEQDAKVLRILE